MGICYDLLDRKNRRIFELGKGPFGEAHACFEALEPWIPCLMSVLSGDVAARVRSFLDAAGGDVAIISDCGNDGDALGDWVVVDSRYDDRPDLLGLTKDERDERWSDPPSVIIRSELIRTEEKP